MKPPLFAYIAPDTLDEAVAARAAHEHSAVLAGGQSLVPTLNFRIAHPAALIDISRIDALHGIAVADSAIVVRAMARQREVELDDAVHRANPLLREALQNVAHIVIRNRGTIVGSLAHADAAAEMPAVLLATGGSVTAQGPKGARTIAAEDLFQFHLTTTLGADEIVTEARFPALPPNTGWAFQEFTRRHGDYALAGVCALITVDGNGVCGAARLAACGVASKPVRLEDAEAALVGTSLDTSSLSAAAEAARGYVTAPDDTQASTDFRKQLLAGLVKRTVARASERAVERAVERAGAR